jgi:hypothetical protein
MPPGSLNCTIYAPLTGSSNTEDLTLNTGLRHEEFERCIEVAGPSLSPASVDGERMDASRRQSPAHALPRIARTIALVI